MRRFVAFLLLCGAGVALLAWIEERSRATRVEGILSETEAADPPEREPAALTSPQEEASVRLSGAFHVVLYDEEARPASEVQRMWLRMQSRASRTEGRIDVGEGVRAELFDPRSGDVQADLEADLARLRRREAEAIQHELSWENRVELEGVRALFLKDVFLAPLEFRSPRAVLDARDPNHRTVRSEGRFTLSSPKLDAEGVGVVVHLDDDLAEIESGGLVTFHRPGDPERGGGERARAASFTTGERGALQIRGTREADEPIFTVQGWEGTELDVSGARPARLSATETTLRTRVAPGGELVLDSLAARGEVVIRLGRNRFEGRAGEIEFDASGQPLRAVLRGLPQAAFPLDVDQDLSQLAGSKAPPDALRVLARGQDALGVRWDQGYRVEMEGPTTLETEGLSVRSARGLQAERAPDGSARFSVHGGVVLETDRAGVLETANLSIDVSSSEDGGAVFRGRAWGGARLVGELQDGRPFSVTTPRELTVRGTPAGWWVEEGLEVELVVEPTAASPTSFRARADRVHDVDLEGVAFQAEGHVRYTVNAEGRSVELEASEVRASSEVSDGTTRYVLEAEGGVWGTLRTEGRVDEVRGESLLAVHEEGPAALRSRLRLVGRTEARFSFQEGAVTVRAEQAEVERFEQDQRVVTETLVAEGRVHFEGEGPVRFEGEGDRLSLDGRQRGSLTASEGRVRLRADDPKRGLPLELTAKRVDFTRETVRATNPELALAETHATADLLVADPTSVRLEGAVTARGRSPRDVPWVLRCKRLVFHGEVEPASDPEATPEVRIRSFRGDGGVDFRLGEILHAEGDVLEHQAVHGTLRFEGNPVNVESGFGRLEVEWVEYDPLLQVVTGTGPGKVFRAPEPEPPGGLADPTATGFLQEGQSNERAVVEFLSTSTQIDVDKDAVVFLIQEPLFRSPRRGSELRASWAVLWIDRNRWTRVQEEGGLEGGLIEELRASFEGLGARATRGTPVPELFELFRSGPLNELVQEVYFEGPVELVEGSRLLFRADAVYLDVVSNRGWLAKATVNLYGSLFGQPFDKIIVKADWLRHDIDGTLVAHDATVTSCNYDEPHIKVVTGDLRILPQPAAGGTPAGKFRLILRRNRVELYDLLRVPLPKIDLATDEEFRPLWSTLSLANSARFGTLLSFAFERPAGAAGEVIDDAVGRKDEPYDATISLRGSYLGSRGGLLDIGLRASSPSYRFDTDLGLVADTGDDKGFIRVPESDRDSFRYWLRSVGSFERGRSTLSVVVSDQSDAGVQSEFYEDEFLEFELDESYVQWHRSKGLWFTQIGAKLQVDSFRSEVEELPSVSAHRSRGVAFRVGNQPVLWSGGLRAEYLRRRESRALGADIDGDGLPDPLASPFGLPAFFPDGLGDRETLRIDSVQTLEAPLRLGDGPLTLTPLLSARGTFWSDGVGPADRPYRWIAEGGARLGTTLWKRTSEGVLHLIAPYLGVRSEIARDDRDVPVPIDEVEDVRTGDRFEAGLRGRFGVGRELLPLDLDLKAAYLARRSDGTPDGWLPLEVFSRLALTPFGRRFDLWYDGRYDPAASRTEYSLVSLGTRFGDRFGIQASHQRGRTATGPPLFETAAIAGIYRWTEKWEFQAAQAFSLLEDQGLELRVGLRRYGHDLVLELQTTVREGEGTSFGFSVKPRFGFRPPRIGYVPW